MLNQLIPLIGQFPLPLVFAPNYAGGLYQPLVAYQDVNGTVPAPAAGDTIAEIADQHTTVETFTTFRTWDFSAGVDGATATNGTLAANIDSILGRNDCLRLTVGASGGATYYEFTLAFFGTTRNRLVISLYVPTPQTYVDGFKVFAGDNSTGTLIYDGANNGSTGVWVDIDVTKYVGSTTIRAYAYIGTSATISASGSGSLMYVRGMVSSYTNLVNQYQPVLASRPYMGSYPNVPGGLGIIVRNTYSDDITQSVWAPLNATKTSSTVLTPTASTGIHLLLQSVSVVAATIMSYKVRISSGGATYVQVSYDDGSSNGAWVNVKLSDGSISRGPEAAGTGANVSGSVILVSAGVYDITISASHSGTTGRFGVTLLNSASAAGGIFASNTLTGTEALNISRSNLQVGAAQSRYQQIGPAYNISETGYPSVLMPYYGGSNFLTTGVKSFAGCSLHAVNTQAFSLAACFRTLVKGGTIGFSKASATAGNRDFQLFTNATTGKLSSYIRGTLTDTTSPDLTDGLFHDVIPVWDGTTMLAYVDGVPYTLTVGSAAEETGEDIIAWARTASSPAAFHTGFGQALDMINRGISAAEVALTRSFMRTNYGSL